MNSYKVKITEINEMEVEIAADSAADAKDLAEKGYNDKTYALGASHLKQVNFIARTTDRSRSYVRG